MLPPACNVFCPYVVYTTKTAITQLRHSSSALGSLSRSVTDKAPGAPPP